MRALLIIDVQNAILEGCGMPDRQPYIDAALNDTVERLRIIKERARNAGAPVIIVQHQGEEGHRLSAGTHGWALRKEIAAIDGDIVVHKKSCDAFFESDLDEKLREQSVSHIVVGGCMTQFCIDTTVRRAVSLGYNVTLIADGHSTADTENFLFSQIISHHNATLRGLSAGPHQIEVRAENEITF